MANPAIVVQTFTKPDTMKALCNSLLACDNRDKFDLIFWSDSATGSRKEAEFETKTAEVKEVLKAFVAGYGDRFRSVAVRGNSVNLGCYKTCQIALDYAFEDHDFVIFSEDDTIFSPDALDWFLGMERSTAFLDEGIWAIAGESIFFDAQRSEPSERLVNAAKTYTAKNRLWEQYITFDFVPSTCFATSREKWIQFSATRGEINGDVDLCRRCQSEGKKCIFPVVARVKDVGMLHPEGYSVIIHTADNVSGVKNCYLISGDIRPGPAAAPILRAFDGDAGQLFSQSTLLNGFDDVASSRPVESNPATLQSSTIEDAREAGIIADWPLALRLWRELKEQGLATVEVDTSIGLCLLKLGNREAAKTAIRIALTTHSDDAYAQSVMGYILEADGSISEAKEIWSRLCQRQDVPEWLHISAKDGDLRCKTAIKASMGQVKAHQSRCPSI